MHRYTKLGAVVLLSISSTLTVAGGYNYTKEDLSGYNLQPNLEVNDDNEYARTGNSVYFSGGYMYTYRFLSTTPQTLTDAQGVITFTPNNVFPSSFDGFQFAVGKEWSRYIEFQLAYLQHLSEDKTTVYAGNSYTVSQKLNALLPNVGIVFNPDDEFQAILRLGVMVSEFYNTVSVNGTPISALAEDQTRVEPAAGMDFVWYFSHHVGFHIGAMYVAETHNQFSKGEVDALAGLSYTL